MSPKRNCTWVERWWFQRIVVVGQLAGEFEDRLARQDHFHARMIVGQRPLA